MLGLLSVKPTDSLQRLVQSYCICNFSLISLVILNNKSETTFSFHLLLVSKSNLLVLLVSSVQSKVLFNLGLVLCCHFLFYFIFMGLLYYTAEIIFLVKFLFLSKTIMGFLISSLFIWWVVSIWDLSYWVFPDFWILFFILCLRPLFHSF